MRLRGVPRTTAKAPVDGDRQGDYPPKMLMTNGKRVATTFTRAAVAQLPVLSHLVLPSGSAPPPTQALSLGLLAFSADGVWPVGGERSYKVVGVAGASALEVRRESRPSDASTYRLHASMTARLGSKRSPLA